MIKINTLSPSNKSRNARKRIGRGQGSGHGGTATRGHKGARSRTGFGSKPGFEGGQMPLHRRLPKQGFINIFKTELTIISLDDLNTFEVGSLVCKRTLEEAGFIKSSNEHVKILANGSLTKPLTVELIQASRGAREKIVAAGGSIQDNS